MVLIQRPGEIVKKKGRILYFSTAMNYGGAETQLVNLVIRLKHAGWETHIVSLLKPKGYLKKLATSGVGFSSLEVNRTWEIFRAILNFRNTIKEFQPDIVHSFMVHANLISRISRLITPIPILISSARNVDEGGKVREYLYKFTDPLTDITTQVCEAGYNKYKINKIVPEHKLKMIPNGVDIDRFMLSHNHRKASREELGVGDKFVWLCVGRFYEQKGYEFLVKAFSQVAKANENSVLILVGEGPLKGEIVNLARSMGVTGHIRFLGRRKDVDKLMIASDGYVMASLWEGMSNALLEASASGLPIVTTDVGGNREIVINGKNGRLVPPGDTNFLADAMLNVMQMSRKERAKMGLYSREHVKSNYTLEKVVELWEQLYSELLKHH